MRFSVYCAASAVVCSLMLGDALLVYPNLFSALVGLSDSVVKVCALINLACCLTLLWTKMVLYLFLGGARANELQTVYNKGWMFLCNSILYWSVRDLRKHITAYDLGVCMLSIFVLIALHWVCSERVKVAFYETDPVSYFNVGRLGILCTILGGIDVYLCYRAVTDFLKGKYVLSLFGMFLLELLEMSVIFIGHYFINILEMVYLARHEDEDEWDQKLLLQTCVALASCTLGIAAHCMILYVFNLNTSDTLTFGMRLVNLFNDSKELRRLLSNKSDVDQYSTTAGVADLERDSTCVICRDEMSIEHQAHNKKAAKRLHCGHVMHASCLKSWMARSDKCPTCRQSVYTAAPAFAVEQQPPAGSVLNQSQAEQTVVADLAVPERLNAAGSEAESAAPSRDRTPAHPNGASLTPTPTISTQPSQVAPASEDEEVADLFAPASPAGAATNGGAEQARTESALSASNGAIARAPPNKDEAVIHSSSRATFSVERETSFSGRIVTGGNVSQAYTFRENYLF